MHSRLSCAGACAGALPTTAHAERLRIPHRVPRPAAPPPRRVVATAEMVTLPTSFRALKALRTGDSFRQVAQVVIDPVALPAAQQVGAGTRVGFF